MHPKAEFVTKLRISGGSNGRLIPIISVKVRFVMFEYSDVDGLIECGASMRGNASLLSVR